MRGTFTLHSPLQRLVAIVVAVATLASVLLIFASPAHGHSPNRVKKERRHIKRRAVSEIGTPYRYGGSSPSGFDCSGFTSWVFENHGANLPRTSIDQFYLARRAGYKRIWKRSRLKKGDLVFHKTTSARVGHAGIYTGRGKFVSATSSSGVRKNSIRDPYYWGPRWVGAVRVPATQRN
jgi:cell wall-associated NlpC family hydrolase